MIKGYEYAMWLMSRLNRNAAKLMHKYGAHAATDVTGSCFLSEASSYSLTFNFVLLFFRVSDM